MANSTFFQDLKTYFDEEDLYKIFDIPKTSSDKQIKKAYKRLSLLHHPDRNDEINKKACTIKFQLVSKIHVILTDKDKRLLYDETGVVDGDDFDHDNFDDWEHYFRILYPKITINEIQSFEQKYKNSPEEKDDLKKYYLKFKGNFNKIMENLMFAEHQEEDRLRNIVKEMIDSGEIPPFNEFIKESKASIAKRKKKAEKENKEFDSLRGSDVDLVTAILQARKKRQTNLDSFYDNLITKHESKTVKRKK